MEKLIANFNYVVAVILFLIGLYAVVVKTNLIKKFMGLNIMETSVFLLIVSSGAVKNGRVPIMVEGAKPPFVNPLPQALILTGIVVAVSSTSLALSLMIRLFQHCGTLDAEELKEME